MVENLTENIQLAVNAVEGEDSEVKAAAARAAVTATISGPPTQDVGVLWRILVGGLVGVLILALGGIIWTVGDGKETTSPDVIVTVFTSALTGLIGLFVKPSGS